MFNDIYKNKKILITGNTGFKGSWLSTWLLNLGANVYGYANDIPSKPSMFEVLELNNRMVSINGDVRDIKHLEKNIKQIKPDFIFHLAAQALVSVSYSSPIDTITTNVVGTANILESIKNIKHECVCVIITSDKCYDNLEWVWGYKETDELGGKDIYSGSKGAAELIFKSYFHSFLTKKNNIKLATTRAGNVIGGGDWAKDRIVPDCIRAWSENKPVEIRSPNATRPWQHVLEPLSGYLNLAEKLFFNNQRNELNGQSFNFGPLSQHNHTVEDIIKDLSSHWDFDNSFSPYEITDNIAFDEAGLLKLNCDKALFYLKWFPVLDYKQLIDFTGSWYYNYNNNYKNMHELTLAQIKAYEEIAKQKNIKWTK